ncbi:MAG TPA: aminoglycoside 6-adenylyltransferase [Anaerolineales bacterium]|nr:aminoglycoside 6-adenylyltransferase [Anaerolineales bacterium]
MKNHLEAYRQSREALLTRIVAELSSDERFLAAWLTGSYGREDEDEVSDLDLSLVVAHSYSKSFCSRQEQVSDQTTRERLALFCKFGEPALIHENNNNAPEDGIFTFVLYSDSALMIDWTIIPQMHAARPFQSRLLFDKANIPFSSPPEPEDLAESKKSVAEIWAFFWMMTAVTVKYMIRKDGVFATHGLENLHGIVQEIERRIHREPWKYRRGSLSQVQPTREKQIQSIRRLYKRMQELRPKVMEFIEYEPAMPWQEIEVLLSLAAEDNARN